MRLTAPRSNSGATPLLFAVRRGDMGAVRALLAAGADVKAARPDGATPLLVAVIVVAKRARVTPLAPYAVLGAALWLATYRSGVHPTIAGVVLGLLGMARG